MDEGTFATPELSIVQLDEGCWVQIAEPGVSLDVVRFDNMSQATTAVEIIKERLSPDAVQYTFGEFADLLIEKHYKPELAKETRDQYMPRLRQLVRRFGHVSLDDITPALVRGYLDALRSSMSVSARDDLRMFMRRVMNRARDWQFIETNPVDEISRAEIYGPPRTERGNGLE